MTNAKSALQGITLVAMLDSLSARSAALAFLQLSLERASAVHVRRGTRLWHQVQTHAHPLTDARMLMVAVMKMHSVK